MNFLDRFWETVHQYPDKTAITDLNGTRIITYRELYMLSGRAAAKLIQTGGAAKKAVLVCMNRSIEYVAAEIGIMMAGAAFVPLPYEYPKEQISGIKKDCGAACTIDAAWMEDIGSFDPVVKGEEADTERALILYASGSDGRPKGIVHSHASLYRGAMRSVHAFGLGEEERLAASAPMSSAVCILEYFAILLSGGCVHILTEKARKDVRLLEDYYADNGITCGFISPKMLRYFKNRDGALKKVFTGGGRLSMLCGAGYELYHLYGTGKTAFLISFYKVEAPMENTPIGTPADGIEILLLDDEGNEVTDGAQGEICVRGIVGECYLNLEEQSARTFVRQEDGSILLHTGDIGQKLPDGNFVCVKRKG